jgi:hypothetical protein
MRPTARMMIFMVFSSFLVSSSPRRYFRWNTVP